MLGMATKRATQAEKRLKRKVQRQVAAKLAAVKELPARKAA